VIFLPALLFAVLVICQGVLFYMARQSALAAARQGVEAARVLNAPPGAGPQAALQLIRTAAPGWLTHPAAAAGLGRTVQVTVTGGVLSLIPIPGLQIHITETVQAPAERFTTRTQG
jgi:hypothetical protein